MVAKTKGELYAFMQSHRHAVIATAGTEGKPEAALMDIAVTDALEIVFETTSATRKIQNLRNNPRVSFVIGWTNDETVQYDGVVDEPLGRELERITRHYLSIFPEKLSHQVWPGNHYFRVRPLWVRFSDYHAPRTIEEHEFPTPPGYEDAPRRFSLAYLTGLLGIHASSR